MVKKVAVIVGSLRKESWNLKLAKVLMKLAPSSLNMELIEIGNLPLYNQDYDDEKSPPQAWTNFRNKIKKSDAVLFVSPEYNRSIPSPLKNALDVGSRPYGDSAWDKKPVGVISSSPGQIGGFGANQHLRQTFVFLDMPVLQAPEAYISHVDKLIGDNLEVKADTEKFLQRFINTYAEWVEKILEPVTT